MDASHVYGSSLSSGSRLRSFTSGLLRTDSSEGRRQLLPTTTNTPATCTQPTHTFAQQACPVAGDSRVSENPMLTIMHTLWLREHNRIARQLAAFNPTWNDETLFQETKRIVDAQLQHITYNEYLPAILG